jgi:hypothetical protein
VEVPVGCLDKHIPLSDCVSLYLESLRLYLESLRTSWHALPWDFGWKILGILLILACLGIAGSWLTSGSLGERLGTAMAYFLAGVFGLTVIMLLVVAGHAVVSRLWP